MVNKPPVAVVGAGGHARVVASTLVASGHRVIGFFDDDPATWGRIFAGAQVIGSISEISAGRVSHAVMGIGDNRLRKLLAQQLDVEWVNVVHPFAWVDPQSRIGPGTLVCAGSVVQSNSEIGAHVILNTRSSVDHDCRVGDYVHIAVAHLAGGASADEGAFMAPGSNVLPGVHVGAWATVGAGAVVRKDVRPGVTVVGVPAREIRLGP